MPSAGIQFPKIQLKDILQRRGVNRVIYFHADHFEPWWHTRPTRQSADAVAVFVDRTTKTDYGKKLTLFYKPDVPLITDARLPARRLPHDNLIGFARDPQNAHLNAQAMQYLVAHSQHEIQLHYHHEHFTYNLKYSDPLVHEALGRSLHLDAARFELGLEETVKAIRADTGLPLQKWFFVHGRWALNASDPDVCHVENEMQILMKHGCIGDFTMPAGRVHVNPTRWFEPMLVKPVVGPKSYDTVDADPIRAATGDLNGRFFIWMSRQAYYASSLDLFSATVQPRLKYPLAIAEDICRTAYVSGSTLYFKTHAHHMDRRWHEYLDGTVFAHEDVQVRQVFDAIVDAIQSIDGRFELVTCSEAFEILRSEAADSRAVDERAAVVWTHALETLVEQSGQLVAELDPTGTRLGSLYSARLASKAFVSKDEIAICSKLFEVKDQLDVVYDFGCGIGSLACLIASMGLPVHAIDQDAKRIQAAELLVARASGANLLKAPVRLEQGRFPATVLSQPVPARSAALFTNVICAMDESEFSALLNLLGHFELVILDLRRFIAPRDAPEAQASLRRRLCKCGVRTVGPIRNNSSYWVFTRQSSDESHVQPHPCEAVG
jgi:hypothetical protein